MDYLTFLTHVIEDGLRACKESYAKPEQAAKLRGAIQGFEGCRGSTPEILRINLHRTREFANRLVGHEDVDAYWEAQCRALETEWVCNCVSALLVNEGKAPIIAPTARGVMKAAEVLSRRN